ncbi:class I SAM-dependent methyltransferase [bacterium]|nr:class I SAM-dependent methyltransferase [bacterium]
MKDLSSTIRKVLPTPFFPFAKNIYRHYKHIKHFGWKHACPLCGGRFRSFIKHGYDDICPHCAAPNRYRLLWLYLKQRTNFWSDSLSILDISPFHYFKKTCIELALHDYVSVDIAALNVSVNADLVSLPFRDNSFDCILCYHVLEHIRDHKKALKEMYRVLNSEGFALIQSPINLSNMVTIEDLSPLDQETRIQLFGQADHFRIYGQDYPEILEQGGFQVTVDDFVRQLDTDCVERYRLDPNELVYRCIKSGHL